MLRPVISDDTVDKVLGRFRQELATEIKRKGRGGWVSSLETRGAVDEEVDEFKEAVRAHDREHMKDELIDVMVAAFWGLASEEAGGWDW